MSHRLARLGVRGYNTYTIYYNIYYIIYYIIYYVMI